MFSRLINFPFLKPDTDLGLLLLRIGIGINLFLKHGLEKVLYFQITAPRFSDLIGIGHIPTFLIAFFTDAICSLLIVFGVATRWVAIFYSCTLLVAWALRHNFLYWGLPPGVPGDHLKGDHGEMILCYVFVMVLLFVAGAGRYSVDAWLKRNER